MRTVWSFRDYYKEITEALFQEGEKSTEMIENWKPTGTNPKNQRHLAVAPNSKAVMIWAAALLVRLAVPALVA